MPTLFEAPAKTKSKKLPVKASTPQVVSLKKAPETVEVGKKEEPVMIHAPKVGKPETHNKKDYPPDTHPKKETILNPQLHNKMTPLTYYAVNPTAVKFETQQEDEEVVLFLRQHIIVNVPWIVLFVFMLLAPTVLFPLLFIYLKLPFEVPVGFMVVGTAFWYLAAFGFFLGNFLKWFFNIYIVTNERTVDIDFVQLLYKQFSEARLGQIQDITYETSGFFAAFFDYGNVRIQTAGNHENFVFESVPKPARVVQTISELAEKIEKGL